MFRLGRSGEWRRKKGGRQPLLWQEIQESFGTTQAAMVWVGVSVCSCMHMFVLGLRAGRQAGRHRETSALDPRAGLEYVYM